MRKYCRMAGMFLALAEGKTIRPAQDCFGGYGKAVIMFDTYKEIAAWNLPHTSMQVFIHSILSMARL